MNYITKKDKWVMLTNGVNSFSPMELKVFKGEADEDVGSEAYTSYPGIDYSEPIFIIEADTEDELFNKVFISPHRNEAGEYHIGCCAAKLPAELYNLRVKPKPKRARDATGKFAKDDPLTPDYNEAWEGGKAPGEE